MKHVSLLLLLLLFATAGQAQKAFIFNTLQKNGFVSLSAGLCQPIGTFAARTSDAGSGMALRGQSMSLSGGYRMAGPLGLMARIEQTYNGIDPSALVDQYVRQPDDQLTGSTPTGRAGQWQTRSIMAGPYITIPIGRVAVDLRAMAGQIWATCPETCVQGKLNHVSTLIRTDNQESKAISAGVGLTARYRLTPGIALHVNGDYTSAAFNFTNVPVESQVGGALQQTTINSQQTLTTATVSTGLTIQFRARNYVF